MSVVTNVILSTHIYFGEEKTQITEEINNYFKEDTGFVNVDDEKIPRGWYGGTKMLEAELFIGAFNHLDLDSLIKHLRDNVNWGEFRQECQLIVKEQEDIGFRIINIFN